MKRIARRLLIAVPLFLLSAAYLSALAFPGGSQIPSYADWLVTGQDLSTDKNVGIGNPDPSAQLDVQTGGNVVLRTESSADNDLQLEFYRQNELMGLLGFTTGEMTLDGRGSHLNLETNNRATWMKLDNTGGVVIGNGGVADATLDVSPSGGGVPKENILMVTQDGNPGAAYLVVKKNSGFVGIGTSNPAATLDVQGPITANGTGGNVLHGCSLVRNDQAPGLCASVTCPAGQTAIAGGGSCDAGSLRGSNPLADMSGWNICCEASGSRNVVMAYCCEL